MTATIGIIDVGGLKCVPLSEYERVLGLLREAQNYVIDVSDGSTPYAQAAEDCWKRIDAALSTNSPEVSSELVIGDQPDGAAFPTPGPSVCPRCGLADNPRCDHYWHSTTDPTDATP